MIRVYSRTHRIKARESKSYSEREREKKSKAGDRRKIESYWWKKTFELVLEIIKNHRHVLLVVAYPSNEISISNGRIFGERGDIFHTYRKKICKISRHWIFKKKKNRNLIKLIKKQSDKNQRVQTKTSNQQIISISLTIKKKRISCKFRLNPW